MRIRAALFAVGLALALSVSTPRANSLLLDATTKSLELETSAAVSVDYVVAYADLTSTTFTGGMNQGNVSTATTTTILAAPGASTQRQVKWLNLRNRSTTASIVVTLKLDVSGTEFHIASPATLAPGESARLDGDGDLDVYSTAGMRKADARDVTGIGGMTFGFQKAGTAKDAAGYWIGFSKDAGFPGAFSLGTPGLNGVNTDCSLASSTSPLGASQSGSHVLQDAASGSLYLTDVQLQSSAAELVQLVDPLWLNTGLVVTTTTAQNITQPTLPARDSNGTTNGEGVFAALLVTTATTNAGTIANTTLSYTDSDGNAGNTATFSAVVGWQAPATPVIGTWMPFQLAAGDRGIRSVQSVTLGTSYAAGALSLVLYRVLATVPVMTAGVGGSMAQGPNRPGVRLYNNSCVWALAVGPVTASNLAGSYTVMER